MSTNVSFETLSQVDDVVHKLVPGYYRQAVNPFETLENQQGNCFTNAVIGALVLSELYGVEPSLAWSERLHARPLEDNRITKKSRVLNIQHIDLVVPRGINEFDILRLAYGLKVAERSQGSPFQANDLGGQIDNYNFESLVKAPDVDVDRYGLDDEPILQIVDDGEIIPTRIGRSLGVAAMDWQHAADEYLDALKMPALDYDKLTELFWAKYTAMSDSKEFDDVE